MKKILNNQLTMHIATSVVLNENAGKFENFTAYPALKAAIDGSITNEQALANSQEMHKRNSVASKNHVKDEASEYILDLSRKVSAYAIVIADRTLHGKIKHNESTVKRCNDNKLVLIFETVLDTANQYQENLLEYGVTEQLLSEGISLLDALKTEIQNQLLINSELKQLTVQLEQQFRTTDAGLVTIDAMVETMRNSDPVMYRLYRNARRKRNRGGSKVSAIGRVFDSVTNSPLPKAKISIDSYNSNKAASGADLMKNVKFSGAAGQFRLKSLPTGTYLFKVTYAGYADQEITAHINEGILTRVEIPLSKLD